MKQKPRPQPAYRFGDWLVEPYLNRLSKGDVERYVEPLAMDVLSELLKHPGQVVTTDELLDTVWSDSHGEPSMVAKRINQIRRVVGDDAKQPTYIATVVKRGYRAIAPVSVPDNGDRDADSPAAVSKSVSAEENEVPDSPAGPSTLRKPRRWAIGSMAAAAAVALLGWITLDLRSGRSPSPPRSIAVLPLENLSGDPEQDYIADGMTEELITELAKFSDLQVTSRSSIMKYKANRPPVATIADELGVDAVIEGSVAREEGRFRVTVQLIDAKTDTHVWAERFDREVQSVLSLRSDIAREVAKHHSASLRALESTASSAPAVQRAAYDAYLRGLAFGNETPSSNVTRENAIEAFEQAVGIDPGFADAWSRLALERFRKSLRAREHYPSALEAAEQALAIDAELAPARAIRGLVHLVHHWDLDAAEHDLVRAYELTQNDPVALAGYHVYLRARERYNDILPSLERHKTLRPKDIRWRATIASDHYEMRLFEGVLREADEVRTLAPSFVESDEALAYAKLGRFEDSHRARVAYYERCGSPCDEEREAAAKGWEQDGYTGSLRALIDEELAKDPPDAVRMSKLLVGIGNRDGAFQWLERAFEARAPLLVDLASNPSYDALRPDPRIDDLLARMQWPTIEHSPSKMAETGRALAFRGRAAEAARRLEQAMAASPDDPRLARWLESMAWAQFAAGNYEATIHWSERALAEESSPHATAFAHLLLASSHAHLGSLDEAEAHVARAQELWPLGLDIDRDLRPLFLGGDAELGERYLLGLRKAKL